MINEVPDRHKRCWTHFQQEETIEVQKVGNPSVFWGSNICGDHCPDRRDFIMLKLRISKLSTTLTALKANYDFHSPTTYHDAAVINHLINELPTMVMKVTI